jgi:diphthamide synthase (EF-2-diphthine--ammonia ligase)
MEEALRSPPLVALHAVASGDLYLQDVRAYREERLRRVGKRALFPLWGLDTTAVAREFLGEGFEAYVVCADTRRLDASFVGRAYDASFLGQLPPGVDPCGENGEFHTFVHAGPCFERRVTCRVGRHVVRGDFAFADLVGA